MEPASRFGPYEIIRRLGKSMNDVYLALDTRANRQAALKLIKSGPDAVSRLVTESERRGAAIQQRLRALDPRVIEVYDYGDLDGYFFVAMQYVEGRNLAEALARDGRMSALRAARIALEIGGQLEKFHTFQPDGASASVVHGDIKPSNIHLGPNDTVRLLDFGIAKTLRPDRDFTFHNFGSPSYCSPERLGRSVLDQQADLWAVGATLYEMVAGCPPYQAEDTGKLEKLIQSRRPPRALPASCPDALRAIIRKSLAPDVDRRYPSAAAFTSDLNAFLEGTETVAEQEKRAPWKLHPTRESAVVLGKKSAAKRWRKRALRVLAALACVLTGMLLFIGTSLYSRYWSDSKQVRATLDWEMYQDLESQFGFLGKYSPVEKLRAPLRAGYEQAGAQAATRADWQKAAILLGHAVELGAGDRWTLARRALALGHLETNPAAAREHFAEASRQAPEWADPLAAAARTYAGQPDEAMAAYQKAAQAGYKISEADARPIAEAYRVRGFDELQAGDVGAARRDFDRVQILARDMETPNLQPPAPRRKARVRRRR
ncbi:MAG TPA: protein kinase [Bryobacteraceae bacterium]|nr:protein kinase [Bryobacteraceae bacterium]